jgi:hypothetical protein
VERVPGVDRGQVVLERQVRLLHRDPDHRVRRIVLTRVSRERRSLRSRSQSDEFLRGLQVIGPPRRDRHSDALACQLARERPTDRFHGTNR